ncbi:penicillin acylase family protein [bacterium]|nr:penicillin acylase family protein [bacterium]
MSVPLPLRRALTVAFVLALSLFAAGCQRGEDEDDAAAAPDDPFGIDIARTIESPGISAGADVLVDTWGIPHIFAANPNDALHIQAYLSCKDRLFEMDMARRIPQGRLGELLGQLPAVGPIAADLIVRTVDLDFRSIMMGPDGVLIADRLIETMDEGVLALVQAYANGVNECLADIVAGRNGLTEPPAYEGLVAVDPAVLEPWTPYDTVSLLMLSLWSASNSVSRELAFGEALAALGPEKFLDFFRGQPADPTTILPDGFDSIDPLAIDAAPIDKAALVRRADELRPALDAIRGARERLDELHGFFGSPGFHSNSWSVAGDRIAADGSFVANDPHLDLLHPPFFWIVHVDTTLYGEGDLNFAGLAIAGAPGVQIGHNGRVGWGGTNAYMDTYDAYVETLADGGESVVFKGGPVKIYNAQQEFFRDMTHEAEPRKIPVQIVPHHGPIVPGSCTKTHCVSLKWTAQEPGTEMQAYLDILFAKDVDEALDAWSLYRKGPYNWAVGDASGRIGFSAAVDMPIRDNWKVYPPYLPLPGDGLAEWVGFVPDEFVPRMTDPESGQIVTANNDIIGTMLDNDPTDDPHYFYYDMDLGLRAGRIDRMLTGLGDPLSLDDMERVQTDNFSVLGRRIVPHLLDAANVRPELVDGARAEGLARLAAWNFTTPTGVTHAWRDTWPSDEEIAESIGATIFHSFFGHLALRTFADEFEDAGLDLPGLSGGPQWEARCLLKLLEDVGALIHGEAWWDDIRTPEVETREEIVLAALGDAMDELFEILGGVTGEWQWGRVHTSEFGLSFEGIEIPSFLSPVLGPAPRGGGTFTVNVANVTSLVGDYRDGHAPGARMVMNVDGEKNESRVVIPGGQSERFDSPHRDDLFDEFLNDAYIPLYWTIDEIVPVTAERIRFTPAS